MDPFMDPRVDPYMDPQMSGAGPPCAIIMRDNVFQAGTVGNGPGPMPKTGPKIGFGFRKLSPQWR